MGKTKRDQVIERLLKTFPNLDPTKCKKNSPATGKYNCAAFAGGDTNRWWQPDFHWHEKAVKSVDWRALESQFYHECGYIRCADGALEPGVEKVAIYADASDEWTHAAHQREDGWWESKIGYDVDILHQTLECLYCNLYGTVVQFLKRERPNGTAKKAEKIEEAPRLLEPKGIRPDNAKAG